MKFKEYEHVWERNPVWVPDFKGKAGVITEDTENKDRLVYPGKEIVGTVVQIREVETKNLDAKGENIIKTVVTLQVEGIGNIDVWCNKYLETLVKGADLVEDMPVKIVSMGLKKSPKDGSRKFREYKLYLPEPDEGDEE